MAKPVIKREAGILNKRPQWNDLTFVATPDVIESIRQSDCWLELDYFDMFKYWVMRVDPRFDFDEVADWITRGAPYED